MDRRSILSIFSMMAVYSSTGTLAYRFQHGNTEYYILKHLLILIMGGILMFFAHRLNYTFYARIANLLYGVSIILLFYTLAFGSTINEASRWATIPVLNVSFQSSDVAKLALIIMVAKLLTKKQDSITDFKQTFLPILLFIGGIVLLILPGNLSTAALVFLTSLVLIYIGGVKIKYLLYLGAAGIVGFLLFLLVAKYNPSIGGRKGTCTTALNHSLETVEVISFR